MTAHARAETIPPVSLLSGRLPNLSAMETGQRALLWLGIIVLQFAFLLLLLIEPMLALALVGGILLFLLALRYPYAAVMLAVTARLSATNSLSIRVGPIFLSAFEPLYVLAFVALLIRSVQQRSSALKDFPAARLLLAFVVWAALSIVWSPSRGEGVMLVIRICIAFGLVWLVASEARTPEKFYGLMWTWLVVSSVVGLFGMMLGTYESSVYGDVAFPAMSGGGRSGGLGQHPNWFAMAMAFGINPAFAMAYAEKSRGRRWLLVGIALWLLVVAVSTGSRGAVWGTGIGSLFLALNNTKLRLFLYRYWFVIAAMFGVALFVGFGGLTSGFVRVATQGITTFWQGNVRFANWHVCYQMLVESFGLGIGAGGYETLVSMFNDRLTLSFYAYPHGVFWDVMAHFGLVGLTLLVVLWWTIGRSYREAVAAVRGTTVELWLIGMFAGWLGYWTHSFVEFHLEDKPYWTFLGIFFGLIIAAKALAADPEKLAQYRREAPESVSQQEKPSS